MKIFMPLVRVAGCTIGLTFGVVILVSATLGALLLDFRSLILLLLCILGDGLKKRVGYIVTSQSPVPIARVGYIVASQTVPVASQRVPPIAPKAPRGVAMVDGDLMAGRTPRW